MNAGVGSGQWVLGSAGNDGALPLETPTFKDLGLPTHMPVQMYGPHAHHAHEHGQFCACAPVSLAKLSTGQPCAEVQASRPRTHSDRGSTGQHRLLLHGGVQPGPRTPSRSRVLLCALAVATRADTVAAAATWPASRWWGP